MRPVQNRLLGSLLRLPLFYKIMFANLAILIVVSIAGATVATRLPAGEATALFVLVGGILVVIANAVILRLALRPLENLEIAAARVHAGDLSQRAELSALADRDMEELIRTFNTMLDRLAEASGRQRDLSNRALRAAEEERKRVAADLHDKIAQSLAGLLMQLSLAKSVTDPDARARILKEASELAATATDEVYRVVQGLRPPALELLGLGGAIEAYARSLSEGGEIEINVETSDDIKGALNDEAEIATYRIVQEALSNVVRHSQATKATVYIQRMPDGVAVTIQDNGVGFATAETLRSPRSLGLFGMQERASYIGGHVEIRSSSAGTTVEVQIPVTEDT